MSAGGAGGMGGGVLRATLRAGPLKVSGAAGGREVATLLRSVGVVSTGTAARTLSAPLARFSPHRQRSSVTTPATPTTIRTPTPFMSARITRPPSETGLPPYRVT